MIIYVYIILEHILYPKYLKYFEKVFFGFGHVILKKTLLPRDVKLWAITLLRQLQHVQQSQLLETC